MAAKFVLAWTLYVGLIVPGQPIQSLVVEDESAGGVCDWSGPELGPFLVGWTRRYEGQPRTIRTRIEHFTGRLAGSTDNCPVLPKTRSHVRVRRVGPWEGCSHGGVAPGIGGGILSRAQR